MRREEPRKSVGRIFNHSRMDFKILVILVLNGFLFIFRERGS